MLCVPVFIFTSGSSALLWCPRLWLSLLAIFNTLSWVNANFFHEKTDNKLQRCCNSGVNGTKLRRSNLTLSLRPPSAVGLLIRAQSLLRHVYQSPMYLDCCLGRATHLKITFNVTTRQISSFLRQFSHLGVLKLCQFSPYNSEAVLKTFCENSEPFSTSIIWGAKMRNNRKNEKMRNNRCGGETGDDRLHWTARISWL